MTSTEQLLDEVLTFCGVHKMKPTNFGIKALNRRGFVADLRKGVSPTLDTVDRIRAFMRDYKPNGNAV